MIGDVHPAVAHGVARLGELEQLVGLEEGDGLMEPHLTATGLTGEPTAFVNGWGDASSRNS